MLSIQRLLRICQLHPWAETTPPAAAPNCPAESTFGCTTARAGGLCGQRTPPSTFRVPSVATAVTVLAATWSARPTQRCASKSAMLAAPRTAPRQSAAVVRSLSSALLQDVAVITYMLQEFWLAAVGSAIDRILPAADPDCPKGQWCIEGNVCGTKCGMEVRSCLQHTGHHLIIMASACAQHISSRTSHDASGTNSLRLRGFPCIAHHKPWPCSRLPTQTC